jgi:hypothetical protein
MVAERERRRSQWRPDRRGGSRICHKYRMNSFAALMLKIDVDVRRLLAHPDDALEQRIGRALDRAWSTMTWSTPWPAL